SRRRGTGPRRASVRNTRARERPDPRRSSPAPGRRKRRRSADSRAPIRDDKVPDAPASGALSHTWGKWFRVHGGGMIGGRDGGGSMSRKNIVVSVERLVVEGEVAGEYLELLHDILVLVGEVDIGVSI